MVSTADKRVRHKKSRKGCAQCKRRHVKCDEQRPTCTACARLELACDFVPIVPTVRPGPTASTTIVPAGSPCQSTAPSPHEQARSPDVWTSTDMRILHHYIHCSCLGFSVGTTRHECWTRHVPDVAFKNTYLLHQILAVGALHSFLQNPDDRDLSHVAAHHRALALEGVQSVMARDDLDSSVSLFAFAGLTAIYCFGELNTKRMDDPKLDVIGELTTCFYLSRGITTVLTARRIEIEDTWASAMISFSADVELARMRAAGLRIEQMQKLSTLIELRLSGSDSLSTYMHAATRCEECIGLLLFNKADEAELSHLVMTWPHEIHQEFVHQLEQREPIALVILAHYAVLMTMSPLFWWLNEWPKLLLDQIQRVLPVELQHYLIWPLQMSRQLSSDT
jgi:hypothetical protein